MSQALSVLVLTEDSGKQAQSAVQAALRHALKRVVPGTRTNRVALEPASEDARVAMRANRWREKKDRRRLRVRLVRAIATKILEDDGFVVFHHDGDTPWSDRPSPHAAAFERLVRQPVEALVRQERDAETAAERIPRLHTLVPHYSLEAWAYQHTVEARKRAKTPNQHAEVDRWEADRAQLDEVDQPKDRVWLGANHNSTLLGPGWPASAVQAAGCSFAAFVDDLRRDGALTAALEATTQARF